MDDFGWRSPTHSAMTDWAASRDSCLADRLQPAARLSRLRLRLRYADPNQPGEFARGPPLCCR
jgi:hypothetical protein